MTTPTPPGGARGPAGPRLNVSGAVDLGALAAAQQRRTAAEQATASGANAVPSLVVEVTQQNLQAVVEQSRTVPVVVEFYARDYAPSDELGGVLARLVTNDAGRWLLARVDVDVEQRLPAAFGVQGVPAVVAVLAGQPVPLFQGPAPEAQVRQVLDELLRVAEANGVTGRLTVDATGADGATEEAGAPATPPHLLAAEEAMLAGNYDEAVAAYKQVLAERPADEEARIGLARVELLARTADADLGTARAAAAANPDDVDAQILAADLDLLGGHVEDAFLRLVDTVRRTSGEERDRVREHLVSLFDVVGSGDPRVAKARTALANALF
ncbi:MAG: tetratricopeptide repeat protein [Actinomycetes bacterium]